MYKVPVIPKTSINNKMQFYEGEQLEEKVRRILENNEPISDSAPTIYTERKDGVIADYNIRTDRWDIAIEGMDTVAKGKLAQRDARENPKKEESKEAETPSE